MVLIWNCRVILERHSEDAVKEYIENNAKFAASTTFPNIEQGSDKPFHHHEESIFFCESPQDGPGDSL